MTRIRRTSVVLCAIAAVATPVVVRAQNASIAVSATVQSRPLTLLGAFRTDVPGELVVRLDGCGNGAIAVDERTATATRRSSRVVLDASASCTARSVTLHLPTAAIGASSFLVTLEQSDALLSPSFAQFVVPATNAGTRTTLAY